MPEVEEKPPGAKWEKSLRSFLVRAGAIVGGGGLVFGYDIGVISGTLPALKRDFDLNPLETGVIVSVLYAGSLLGCIMGGPTCDKLGRWRSIQLQNLVFVLGAIATAAAKSKGLLILGRFMVGVASAISGLADVPYLTEVAPPEYRGLLSGQYEILVAAGILLSFCLDLLFDRIPEGWRWALLIPGALAALQSCAMLILPETPKWLLGKGRREEAGRALRIIYGHDIIDDLERSVHLQRSSGRSDPLDMGNEESWPEDMADYYRALLLLPSPTSSPSPPPAALSLCPALTAAPMPVSPSSPASPRLHLCEALCGDSREAAALAQYRYPLAVVLALQTWAQVSGANVVRNYAPILFEASGVSSSQALVFNLALGGVKFAWTVWAVGNIESHGRLWLLSAGIAAVLLGMITLTCSTHFLPMFIVGCVLVYSGFGLGYGPVPWVLSAEVVPTLIRARVVSHSLLASNLAQLVTNLAFLPMVKGLGAAGCFAVFVVLNLLSLAYTRLFVVETRALPPNDILQRLLDKYDQALALCKGGGIQRKRASGWTMLDQADGGLPVFAIEAGDRAGQEANHHHTSNTSNASNNNSSSSSISSPLQPKAYKAI